MSTCFVNPNVYFYPAARLILSITQSNPALITTTNNTQVVGGVLQAVPADHGYETGLIVRIDIPQACGMRQLNGFAGEIIVTSPTTFTLDVDTSNYDAFAIPLAPDPFWAQTCAQVIPFAEDNSMLTSAVQNTLP
jgi:hypothetical protein